MDEIHRQKEKMVHVKSVPSLCDWYRSTTVNCTGYTELFSLKYITTLGKHGLLVLSVTFVTVTLG